MMRHSKLLNRGITFLLLVVISLLGITFTKNIDVHPINYIGAFLGHVVGLISFMTGKWLIDSIDEERKDLADNSYPWALALFLNSVQIYFTLSSLYAGINPNTSVPFVLWTNNECLFFGLWLLIGQLSAIFMVSLYFGLKIKLRQKELGTT